MRVLGIDCGTERTGFGVIDTDGGRHRVVASGVIRTSPSEPMPRRLAAIAAGLRAVMADCRPDCAAVEEVFHSANTKTALKLAQVRGVALLLIEEAGLALGEYSPAEIKMSVVGYGRAEKAQVQLMARSLLDITGALAEDAADALAVAICHAAHSSALRRIGAAR